MTPRRYRAPLAIAGLLFIIPSCGDDPAVQPTPGSPTAAALVVTPENVLFTALGDTLRLTAEVRDQQGRPMSGAAVAWNSSDASIAVVAQSGVARAVAAGTATITATSGSVSDEALVTVRQDIASVVVSPRVASLVVGDTVRLTAEARDANGNPIPGSAFVWRTSSEQVAGVDSTGLVRAHGRGEATITATSGSVSDDALVTVRQDVASVVVSPSDASLVVGDTVRLTAEARDANANPVPGSAFVWRTSSEQVAGFDSTGLVRAHGRGQATITAVSAGATGSAAVSVAPPNLPPNFAVAEGTTHTLQFAGLHVAHLDIRPAGARPPVGHRVRGLQWRRPHRHLLFVVWMDPATPCPRRCTSTTERGRSPSTTGSSDRTRPVASTRARPCRETSTATEDPMSSFWATATTTNRFPARPRTRFCRRPADTC